MATNDTNGHESGFAYSCSFVTFVADSEEEAMNDPRKSLKVLPITGAAGKLEELRKQQTPSPPGRGWPAEPGEGAAPAKKLNEETPIDRALDQSLTHEQRKIKEKNLEALQQVYDLGLIYRLDLRPAEPEGTEARAEASPPLRYEGTKGSGCGGVGGGQIVEIEMTLTAPNCPVAEQIPRQVHEAVAAVAGVEHVEVRLVWEPRWDKSRMSEVALLELGLL